MSLSSYSSIMFAHFFVNKRLEKKLLLITALISLLLGAIGINAYRVATQAQAVDGQAIHINEQLRVSNRMMIALLSIQNGQRGFLLSNKSAYLAPYEEGIRQVQDEMQLLSEMFRGDVKHLPAVRSVDILRGDLLTLLAESVALARSGQRQKAIDMIQSGRGLQVMENLRKTIGTLQNDKREELASISVRSNELEAKSQRTLLIFIGVIFAFLLLTHYVLFRDLTERRRLMDQLKDVGRTDPLTGLSNSAYLKDMLGNILKHCQRDGTRAAILLVNMNDFGRVNERFGFEYGDRLLKSVAGRLRDMARKTDVLARMTGNTFVLVMPHGPGMQEIEITANRIIQALAPPLLPAMGEDHVWATVGISVFPEDAHDGQALLVHANAAASEAKREGKYRYRFYKDNTGRASDSHNQLLHALHRAVDQREFVLHYQPQVDLKSGRIVGVEALLRWPTMGEHQFGPNEFIPLLENTRLILPVGAWVLAQACHQAALWHAAGHEIRMAVNVSVLELVQTDYPDTVADALKSSGLPAHLLEIEITERSLMDAAAGETIVRLREMGVLIAIDDFGTLYSSLNYLATLPVDLIKIDKSFLVGTPFAKRQGAVVRAIVKLAGELNLNTIAEGVETESQAQFLVRLGVTTGQGYHYHKALPVGELDQILTHAKSIIFRPVG